MSHLMFVALAIPFAAAPVDAKAADNARLDEVLAKWAKASDAVKESHFTIRLTMRDEVTEFVSTSDVEVFVRKPDLIRLDCKEPKNRRTWLVYKDRTVRYLTAADKVDRRYQLSEHFGFPEHPERYPDDFLSQIGGGFLERVSWLAVGPPVRDLKSRFDLRLSKEDDYYLYIDIKPRKDSDKHSYRRMRVVLYRKDYQLRQLWFEGSNSSAVTYDYERRHEDKQKPITPESILEGLPHDYEIITLP